MTALTGKALKDRASELEIAGRSKMSADELREVIARVEATIAHAGSDADEELEAEGTPEELVLSTPGPSNVIVDHDPELDTFKLVPNRKDRRRAKKLARRHR